jgi:ABC-type ATPase with predicted acetyltransferase domain
MTRRCEFFQITKYARRYDKRTGKFIINVAYKAKTDITDRTIAVAEAFGLGISDFQQHVIYDDVELKVGPQDVTYVTAILVLEKVCFWMRLCGI